MQVPPLRHGAVAQVVPGPVVGGGGGGVMPPPPWWPAQQQLVANADEHGVIVGWPKIAAVHAGAPAGQTVLWVAVWQDSPEKPARQVQVVVVVPKSVSVWGVPPFWQVTVVPPGGGGGVVVPSETPQVAPV